MPLSESTPRAPARWRTEVLALVALLLLVLLPRVVALGADPPLGADLGGAFWDEGVWARNARQHVLFGPWVIDEINPAMFVAPLYTVVLSGVYRLAGVGLAQTRLLSGVAGFLTCLLVYLMLRRRPAWPALASALVLGTSYFVVTSDRVGFTESFQLTLITATAVTTLLGTTRPAWAALSGACFAASLLAKPSAAVMAPVLAAFWIWHWHASRRGAVEPAFSPRQPLLFCLSAGVVLAAVALLVVLPHWEAVGRQLEASLRSAFLATSHADSDRIALFGWNAVGLSFNGFFRQMAIPLAAAGLFLLARVAGTVERPLELVEVLCWSWFLVGLAFLATQAYQPDRRFLFLAPPVAMLACLGAREGALVLPGAAVLSALSPWRRMLIGAIAGGFLGFYLQPYLAGSVTAAVAGLGRTLSPRAAGELIWSLALLVGAVTALAVPRGLPPRSLRVPLGVAVLAFVLFNPVRLALYARHLSYTVRDASRDIARLTEDWPSSDRVMIGGAADTFGLETDLFTFAVRIRPRTGVALNVDGWERYRPSLALITMPAGDRDRRSLRTAEERGLVQVRSYDLLPDAGGTPRWTAVLLIRPELCRAGCSPVP